MTSRASGCVRIAIFLIAASSVGYPWPSTAAETVQVMMKDRDGKTVGVVDMQDTTHGVLIRGKLSGLPPGDHAFHIHETGKCEPPFETAGGHVHDGNTKHGFANPQGFHAGDLPNIHVPDSGNITIEAFATKVRLNDGAARLLDDDGSALILHAKADDYQTDPAGAAGDRIACGTVRRLEKVSPQQLDVAPPGP